MAVEDFFRSVLDPGSLVRGGLQGGGPVPGAAGPQGGGVLASLASMRPEDLLNPEGGLEEEEVSPESLIRGALAASVQAVLPTSGFQYGRDPVPNWFPQPLQELVLQGKLGLDDLQQIYDPYMGMLDQNGDERVYLGDFMQESWVKDKKQTPDPELSGKEAKLYGDSYTDKTKKKRKSDKTLTYLQAKEMPYTWDEDEVESAMARMRKAGLNVTSFAQLKEVWTELVDRASKTYSLSAGQRKVTPWDVLELHKREQKSAGTLIDYESGTQKQTFTSVSEISEGASWQTLRTTLSSLLGRDPSDQEVRDYAYRMNTLAAQNPSITETITRYKGGQAVGSDSTTTGGFDAGDMAQAAYEEAQDDPEYAKVQAGTTYFNALLQGIGAVGQV